MSTPPARRHRKGPGWPDKVAAVGRALQSIPEGHRPRLELSAVDAVDSTGPSARSCRIYTVRLTVGETQIAAGRLRWRRKDPP